MKLLKMILNNAGKFGLSPAQTAGVLAATTVGVIGLGMMMTGSSGVNPDTAFSSSDDVVYVSSTAGGVYDGVGYANGNYGEGGEVRSSIKVKQSRDWQLMEQDAMKQPEVPSDPEESATSDLKAFSMDGQSTGLNMGDKGLVDTGKPGQGSMSAFQQQIANMQAMAEQKQKEAAAAAAAGQGAEGVAGIGQGGVAGKTPKKGFDRNSGINTSGGSNLNAQGLQPTGVNASNGGGNAPGAVKTPDASTVSSRNPRFSWSREAEIEEGKKYKVTGADEVEQYLKYSADLAKDKNRSVNALAYHALAGSGHNGIMIVDGQVTTGGASSDDFKDPGTPGLAGQTKDAAAFRKDVEQLEKDMDDYISTLNGWNVGAKIFSAIFGGAGMGWLKYINPLYWLYKYGITPLITQLAKIGNDIYEKIDEFKERWKGQDFGPISNTFATNAKKIIKKVDNWLNLSKDFGNTDAGGLKDTFRQVKIDYENAKREVWPERYAEENK